MKAQNEWVSLPSTETAATEDGHLHSENEGTSGNATGVSQPTIQSEPSIENFVDFEKILTASEVIQEKMLHHRHFKVNPH